MLTHSPLASLNPFKRSKINQKPSLLETVISKTRPRYSIQERMIKREKNSFYHSQDTSTKRSTRGKEASSGIPSHDEKGKENGSQKAKGTVEKARREGQKDDTGNTDVGNRYIPQMALALS